MRAARRSQPASASPAKWLVEVHRKIGDFLPVAAALELVCHARRKG
jgi:hypothetical protein